MVVDRRKNPRIPLEHIFYLTVISADQELPAVLLDISVCGARIGFTPNQTLPPVNSELTFQETSFLAEILANRKATVMWQVGVQCGLLFTKQLDTKLEHIAKLLESEIFYQ